MSNHTRIVPDVRTRAPSRATISEDAKVHSLELRNWHALYDWCREDGEQEKDEGHEKQDREWCCRSKHDGGESKLSNGYAMPAT